MPLTVEINDGFDHYPVSPSAAVLGSNHTWAPAGSTPPTVTFVTGFRGRGKAIHIQNDVASGRIQRPTTPMSQISQHMSFKMTDWDGDNVKPIFTWRDITSLAQFQLYANPNRTLSLYRGNGTNLLATSALSLNENVVHRLNFAFDFTNPVSGSADLWIDGDHSKGFTISATDILASALNTVDLVSIDTSGYGAGVVLGHVFEIDDLMICSGAAQNIGELEIVTDGPISDIQKQWTPSTGTDNFEMVNEIPPNGDTDLNSSAVPGNVDLQHFGALPTSPDSIFCLTQIIAARKEEAGTRTIAADCKITTEHVGTNHNLTTDYDWYYESYLKNPETAAAWLAAERLAASFGYKDIA